MPKTNVVAPPDHDAAVDFLLREESLGCIDAIRLAHVSPFPANLFGCPAPRHLDLTALRVHVHRQRQSLKTIDTDLGSKPAFSFLAARDNHVMIDS